MCELCLVPAKRRAQIADVAEMIFLELSRKIEAGEKDYFADVFDASSFDIPDVGEIEFTRGTDGIFRWQKTSDR